MNFIKLPLNYGSMAGVAAFVIFLLIYVAGGNPLGGMSWLAAWVPILFIVLGIKKHRDQNLGGYISYGQALGTGVIISLVFASLYAILVYLFGTLIDDVIVTMTKEESMKGMDAMSQYLSEEMYDQIIEELEKTSVVTLARGELFNKTFGGIIITLIAAAFLKKSRHPLEEAEDE
jgi:hypothetical protein